VGRHLAVVMDYFMCSFDSKFLIKTSLPVTEFLLFQNIFLRFRLKVKILW